MSAHARKKMQGLRATITTLDRLVRENQTLFLYSHVESNSTIIGGGIKTGYKELYLVSVRSAAFAHAVI